ncbi:MAG TPA: LPS-assembly protein LptD, partial [Ferruginibacter sp.]|nr:LPS-assembly protein LptD [Ferruginibacter sp.]
MHQLNKGKAKYILVLALMQLLFTVTLYCSARGFHSKDFHSFLTTDTLPLNKTDTLKPIKGSAVDTNIIAKTDTFSFRSSKDALDAPVYYHADDSMVMDIPAKKIILYGKQSFVKYLDNELYAPRIEFDQRTNLVSAYLVKDSAGEVIARPSFNQGDFKTVSDTMAFNLKTGKGITKSTYTQQGEIFFHAERIKKVDPEVFYGFRGQFTTCNL